ncbi:MAG: DoxD-like protein family protein [Parcubacteria group bacterium GW2011_GWA2_44_12]|nr:MAG: DoxD-like protein family protein [Parcubacteria group bacterium GW2011_GWA2_44_12]
MKKIIIAGGGFGGIRAALGLLAQKNLNAKITLVSDRPHFEYHPMLFRVVTGKSPLSVCIPLREIFRDKKIDAIQDSIIAVDVNQQTLVGSSGTIYDYDFLVLAFGSETVYFNIPGIKELSFGFKSINEALRLKRHLHEIFTACKEAKEKDKKISAAHILIIGAGPSGVELAGDIAMYSKKLAERHGIDPSLVTIDLIEAAPRVLPALSPAVSKRALQRLNTLGINIFLNRTLVKEEVEAVYLKDMEIKAKTVIWTAGVKPHHLYEHTHGIKINPKGRVHVDEFLQAHEAHNVFVIGDAADTRYAGMAQTALHDGAFIAKHIARTIKSKPAIQYVSKKPAFAIPIGNRWAAVTLGRIHLYGILGWSIRCLADLRFFLSILPPSKAIAAFRSSKTLCESCPMCGNEKDFS